MGEAKFYYFTFKLSLIYDLVLKETSPRFTITTTMVCIPCIVIPLVLWFWHKYIQPYVLMFWNPWGKKIENDKSSPPGDSGEGTPAAGDTKTSCNGETISDKDQTINNSDTVEETKKAI